MVRIAWNKTFRDCFEERCREIEPKPTQNGPGYLEKFSGISKSSLKDNWEFNWKIEIMAGKLKK